MDEPPFSLAFVMVKESFAGPAILFYLASDANKNKREDDLKLSSVRLCVRNSYVSKSSATNEWRRQEW